MFLLFFRRGNGPTFLERHRRVSKDDNYAFTVHGQIYIVSTRRVLSRQDVGNRAILLGSPVHALRKSEMCCTIAFPLLFGGDVKRGKVESLIA